MYLEILFIKNINEVQKHLVKQTEIICISNVQYIVSINIDPAYILELVAHDKNVLLKNHTIVKVNRTELVLWLYAVMYFP
jgi:hypothetical protein